MTAEKLNKALVDLACKHHLNNVDSFLVGHSHTIDKLAFLANGFEHCIDFGSAAVNKHNIDSDKLHKNEVTHNCRFKFFVYHSVSAVFYNNCFARIFLDIGHCLYKYLGSL